MMSALARWIAELKRRHVLRVVSVYAVCAWLIIQIAATTFPYLRFPDWAVTAVIVLGVVGLPIVFVVSWMFDLTPTGVERTPASGAPPSWRRRFF